MRKKAPCQHAFPRFPKCKLAFKLLSGNSPKFLKRNFLRSTHNSCITLLVNLRPHRPLPLRQQGNYKSPPVSSPNSTFPIRQESHRTLDNSAKPLNTVVFRSHPNVVRRCSNRYGYSYTYARIMKIIACDRACISLPTHYTRWDFEFVVEKRSGVSFVFR